MTEQQQGRERVREKLRRELGELNCFLSDPDVIEVQATGNGSVHLDRMSTGKHDTGITLPEARREMIIGTVAAWHGLVVHREQPLLKAELPLDGGRFQGMVRPVSPPSFVIRRPFNRVLPLEQFVEEHDRRTGACVA
jgi:Flp pilus assembly CpaF family ATPase